MVRVVLPFPVLPGKTAAEAKAIGDEFMRRPDEWAESRRRQGVTLERAYLQTTPMGMFVVAYIEGEKSFTEVNALVAASDLDIDTFFVNAIRELHGVDVSQAAAGPQPETIGVWTDSEVSERRRGLAFSAPGLPGTEAKGRAFIADAFGRPGMAESRRAIGNNLEVVSVITTPAGPVVGVYVEGRDPAAANRSFAASTSEFDTWFKDQLRAIHPPFIDFNQPVQGIEEIFDSEAILARR